MDELGLITSQTDRALRELLAEAGLKPGEIVVVGCSTSEIAGLQIGTATNLELAGAVMNGLLPLILENGCYLAVQGCEHINRALVVEEECAGRYGLEPVSVVPHTRAGGSLAAIAVERFINPVVVENISGHAGLDIGDTFIGMHLKQVAIPVRLKVDRKSVV